jgi:tRNA(Arg) A34 adenosine deaminase TadA
LELAWEAFAEGSLPVGSVITDAAGHMVAEGRNRAFGAASQQGGLGGTYIAHAEINALSALPPGDYPDHTIWTSLEPCFMCSAAIFHSHVGTVRFAAADPLMSGVAALPSLSGWVRSRWPQRIGPLGGRLGALAGLLHLVWHIPRRPDGVVMTAYREAAPDLVDVAQRVVDSRLLVGESLTDTMEELWSELAAPS